MEGATDAAAESRRGRSRSPAAAANDRSPSRSRSRSNSRSRSRSRSRSVSPDSRDRAALAEAAGLRKSSGQRIGGYTPGAAASGRGARTGREGEADEQEHKDAPRAAAAAAASSSSSSAAAASAVDHSASLLAASSHASSRAARLDPSKVATRGGVYMPPHKLKALNDALLASASAGSSEPVQKLQWEALRKSINGLINKVNASNLKPLLPELFGENIIRGRGLLVRSIMKAQLSSPAFTPVYAALTAVLNTKMPEIGELLLKRVLSQFRRAFKRNDKLVCIALSRFIAHATNQNILHELVALQLLTLLLENPTDDSVEIAIEFVKECGAALTQITPQGVHGIFERFRGILNESLIDRRVQYMIEAVFAVRKTSFKDYPPIAPELDLVELEEQVTHELNLDAEYDVETGLNVFKFDPEWDANERAYAEIKKEILGDDDDEEGEGEDAEMGEDAGGVDGAAAMSTEAPVSEVRNADGSMRMMDMSEQDVINLRRSIYLTIMSSLDFEESAHKIMKLRIPAGQEHELVNMLIECQCRGNKANKTTQRRNSTRWRWGSERGPSFDFVLIPVCLFACVRVC